MNSEQDNAINYTAAKTVAEFHRDNSFCRYILGPIGSGKSSAIQMEILLRTMQQKPNSKGVRKTRSVILRNTYSELRTTTINTFLSWFGQIAKLSMSPPPQAFIEFPLPDGTRAEIHIIFLAMDSDDATKKLLSLEVTFGILDEFIYIPEHAIRVLMSRVGRFPSKADGGPTFYGIWGASNPGSTDHWSYQQFVSPPSNVKFFHQPPGVLLQVDKETEEQKYVLNPQAENLDNLPPDYYTNLTIGQEPDFIKVFLQGSWGEVRAGAPVFPEYSDATHATAYPQTCDPTAPITIGVDIGVAYNAAIFVNYNLTGELVCLDELVVQDKSISTFVADHLIPFIANKYPRNPISIFLDPAAMIRSASDGRAALDIFKDAGLTAQCAATNNPTARKEAVVYFLKKMIDGKPAFRLSPTCEMLRKALISGYKYERVQKKGEAFLSDQPVKNKYSHIADALQYACMAFKEIKTKRFNEHIISQRRTRPATRVGY